jgi:hypothetical protein
MVKTASVVILLFVAAAVFAANADPTVKLYNDVLEQLKNKPDSPTVLLALRPPSDRANAEQRAALDSIVSFAADSAKANPKSFALAHNDYLALWSRYTYYRDAADATEALARLKKAEALVEPGSAQWSQCAIEHVQNMLALTPEHSAAVFAAKTGPTAQLYKDVLEQLKNKPDSPDILLNLRPPTDRADAEQRAALDSVVTFAPEPAKASPKSFEIAYNDYFARWTRYVYYRDVADATEAFALLKKAEALAGPGSEQQARCALDRAQDVLALTPEHAATICGEPQKDAAINQFVAAKKAAQNKGPYASRAALALGDLYIEKSQAKEATEFLREALDLDPERGYVTNQAYDRLGLILLAERNLDGAQTMLMSAAKITPDHDLKTAGYASRLARALIESGRFEKPVEYLELAHNVLSKAGGRSSPDLLYALAYGLTKMDKSGPALMYWKQYLDLNDPDEAQRKKGAEHAHSLAVSTSKGQ